MKPFTISVASAALLAAATLGAQAQERKLPDGSDQAAPMEQKQGEPDRRRGGREMQGQPGAQKKEQMPGERQGQRSSDEMKKDAQSPDQDRKHRAQDQKDERNRNAQEQRRDRGKMEQQQGANPSDQDRNRKAADQNQGGNRQAGSKVEIKPEQKVVIKQTIQRQNIRPQHINVQVRVGERIPHTVVLHAVPEVIVNVHPDYRRYKIVLLDEDTILIIDPVTWEIVDVLEI